MDLEDLARQVAEDRKNGFAPFMVVGTAGTTAAGVIDPLPDLARFCRREKLMVSCGCCVGRRGHHLAAAQRHHLAGIDAADSITCDAHKWFSVPMGAGMFFCRHADAVAEAFRAETSYMPRENGRARRRSVHDLRAMVPAVYRLEALPCARAARRIGVRRHDRAPGSHGRRAAGVAEKRAGGGSSTRRRCRWCASRATGSTPRKFLAALHERQIAWMSEVRLGGARSGPAGVHHQFSDH